MNGKVGVFLAGGLIGAVAALLYAPRTGEETRALVADKANEAWGTARQYGFEAQVRGQEIYNNAASQGKVAYETASANMAHAYANVSTSAQQAYNSAAAGARDAVSAAQARVADARESVMPAFSERNDELREKIEAARQRIASQVAKNAEEAVAAAQAVIRPEEGEDGIIEEPKETFAEELQEEPAQDGE